MKFLFRCIKNIFFIFVFCFLLKLPLQGCITVIFGDDERVTYKITINKKISETTQAEILPQGLPVVFDQKNFFNVKFLKNEKCYELTSSYDLPEDEVVVFILSEKFPVIFKGELNCKFLWVKNNYPYKKAGNFINEGKISFVNTIGLQLCGGVTFQNKGDLIFKEQTILFLEEKTNVGNRPTSNVLINDKDIHFEKTANIVGIKAIDSFRDPFVFSAEENPLLINHGHIQAKKKLGLFTKCYLSETGRISSEKKIIIDWKRKSQNKDFVQDLSKKIPLKKTDSDFPIIDIIRIPDKLREDKSISAGDLGEKAAFHYYEKFLHHKSFSHKSNNQGNGIDVIAYDDTEANRLMIHESKNLQDNDFKLGNNQMTQHWIYNYLFRMYQDFVDEIVCQLTTKRGQMFAPNYEHVKTLLQWNLCDSYFDDLDNIIDLNEKPADFFSLEKRNNIIAKIKEIAGQDASKIDLNTYIEFYFRGSDIVATGNSIIHCRLPIKEDLGFDNNPFTEPTYFARRNLKSRFAEEGVPPQPSSPARRLAGSKV